MYRQQMRHFRPIKSSLCILLTLAVNAGSQQPRSELGVYLGWVGTYPGNRLQEGARLAKQSGFQTIRLPLVASFETDFGIGIGRGTTCHGKQTLASLVSLPAYAKVLADPAFRTIFLTVWGDSNSYDACDARDPKTDQHPHKRYLDKTFYSIAANRDRTRNEYADLTYRIYKTYQRSGKVFGISNWEGDNELYCDSAYYFANNPAFRSTCEAKRNTIGRPDRIPSVFRASPTGDRRRPGARNARRAQRRLSYLGNRSERIPVPQRSSLAEHAGGRYSLSSHAGLRQLLRLGKYRIHAPSSSLGISTNLQNRFQGHVIVGEFGFDRGLDPAASEHASSAIGTMRRARVPYAIWWQIFDQPPLAGLNDKGLFGLYDDHEKLTAPGKAFLDPQPAP